jgi:hypothetical protein
VFARDSATRKLLTMRLPLAVVAGGMLALVLMPWILPRLPQARAADVPPAPPAVTWAQP